MCSHLNTIAICARLRGVARTVRVRRADGRRQHCGLARMAVRRRRRRVDVNGEI